MRSGTTGGWCCSACCRPGSTCPLVDSLAIGAGTWTIDPEPVARASCSAACLPVEEFIFFGLTNMLIVFGMVLFLATDNVAVKRWSRRVFGNKPYLEEREVTAVSRDHLAA